MKKIILLSSVALLFIGCGSKGPKDVASEFIQEAIINENYDALKKYATPSTLSMIQLSLGLACNVKNKGYDGCYKLMMDQSKNKIKKFEITDVKKIDDNHAVVKVKEYLTNGRVKYENLDLYKIDGNWKVGIKK